MTNYKVRAAGNDNVILFQIKGFPTDSFAAGPDLLEYGDQLLGRVNFLTPYYCHMSGHLLLDADIKSSCDFLLD